MQAAPEAYGHGAKKPSTSFTVRITKLRHEVILYKRHEGREVTNCALPRLCIIGDWSREYAEGFIERQGKAFDKLGIELAGL